MKGKLRIHAKYSFNFTQMESKEKGKGVGEEG